MKKYFLIILPALLLCACESEKKYTVGTDAFCIGLEEESMETVFCKDAEGKPLNGFVTQYFDDGKIAREITIRNGHENGVEREYYTNGNLKVSAMIDNGQPVGVSKLYHENGQLHMVVKWNNGNAQVMKVYDESGKLISTGK